MRVTQVVTAAALVVLFGCSRNQAAPQGGQGFPPAAVKLAVAHSSPIEDTTEYVATLKSLQSTTIQPQIDGQIIQILVKSGDRVRQGAPLMQIDPRRQQAAVTSQEAERASREASVSFARQRQQRASALAAGAISKQELEEAETGTQDRGGESERAAGPGAAGAGPAPLLHRRGAHCRHHRRRARCGSAARSRRRRC